jgi:hypothetical protein
MAEVSDGDLGMLVICASGYGSRLPYGLVPDRIWELLTPEWRRRVRECQDERERLRERDS